MTLISFIIFIIFNVTLIFFNSKIAQFFNLYDIPNKRKIHKKKIPLTGGLIIMLNILLYLTFLNKIEIPTEIFENIYSFYLFIFTAITIFVFGILDDKFVIPANTKFILIILILLPIIVLDNSIQINKIRLSFINSYYDISPYGIIWTLICFLLLLNAINMFDGINLQVGLYFLTILFLFLSKDFNKFFFFY
jgi:UDP-N-acetylmuramyl pentapeptide phosphotransferase/UDP-N-acetylglucosamine-1-phosphate transferase